MYNTSLIKFFILYFCSLNVCSIQVSCTDTFQCSALGTYMPPRTLASTARCPPVSVRTDVPPGRSHPTLTALHQRPKPTRQNQAPALSPGLPLHRPRPPSPPPRGPGSSSRRRAAGRAGLEGAAPGSPGCAGLGGSGADSGASGPPAPPPRTPSHPPPAAAANPSGRSPRPDGKTNREPPTPLPAEEGQQDGPIRRRVPPPFIQGRLRSSC